MSEQSIFLAILELNANERSEFLNRTCAGNEPLRREVEALLAAHERSGTFLNVPAMQQIAAKTPVDQNTVTASADEHGTDENTRTAMGGQPPIHVDDSLSFLKPPTRSDSIGRLDHYEVLEKVGSGGFGTVLKVFDESLHRVVAIKVLAPQLAASGTARARFIREARSAAPLKSEHIVGIHAINEGAHPYLVMEFVAGQTLQQKIDATGPLGVKEILRIGQQIAAGLAAAHATGLVHRDIKPANVLLENGVERVKITDFGLARAADDASISQSGVVAGTPTYMAPEQARGEPVDHRADLFSLGSVMYAMCTGRPPFRASTTMATLKRVCDDTPRAIREINPEIPEWLCDVVIKLHAKNPTERFQSAKEVSELLAKYLKQLQMEGVVTVVEAGRAEVRKHPDDVKLGRLTPSRSKWTRRFAKAALIAISLFAIAALGNWAWDNFYLGSIRVQTRGLGGAAFVYEGDDKYAIADDHRHTLLPGRYTFTFERDGEELYRNEFTIRRGEDIELKIPDRGVVRFELEEQPTAIRMSSVDWNLKPGEHPLARERQVPIGIYPYSIEWKNGLTTKGEWAVVRGHTPCIIRVEKSSDVDPASTIPFPNPVTLATYATHIGKQYRFDVVGSAEGSVWGTDVYSADSTLAAAAVHAGFLKPGQRGILHLTILPAHNDFKGSVKNGVTSAAWPFHPASFRINRLVRVLDSDAPVEDLETKLKKIGVAMHLYHDAYDKFPTPASAKDGKPLLSWRVHLLPYLGQDELYKQFKIEEPWDSEHNRKLIAKIPPIYDVGAADGKTSIVVPVGADTIFPGPKAITLAEITKGAANTAMVLECDSAQRVVWTKPDDWPLNPYQPSQGLPEQFWVARADGSVFQLSSKLPANVLRSVFSRTGESPQKDIWTIPTAPTAADPGTLAAHQNSIDKYFSFVVVGSLRGSVWGSGTYTTDSGLAAAAVHAGVLKPGQRGTLRVKIVAGQNSYRGSAANGVTSSDYAHYPASFRIVGAANLSDPATVVFSGTVAEYRGQLGNSFEAEVMGAANPGCWGTDIYTDDSDLGTASVHAGIVKVGEIRRVKVTILAGQASYVGSKRNGITTSNYAQFPGSFKIEAATGGNKWVLPDSPDQVLPALAGAWKGEFTQKIYGGKPDEKKFSALAVNDWIVDKKWLRQRVHMEDGGFLSLVSFDPSSKTFHDWMFSARGLIFGPSAGRWDSATRTMTWTNSPEDGIVTVTTWRFVDAETVAWDIVLRDKEGTSLFEMTSRMKRTTEHVAIDETTSAGSLPAEMAILEPLVGDWNSTALIKDLEHPDGETANWQETARKILGGRVIVMEQTGGLPIERQAYSLSTFDSYAKAYRRYVFQRDGNVLEYGGGWDANAKTMKWHWARKDGSQATNTWDLRDDNRRVWQVVIKDALGKTQRDWQATSVRIWREAPRRAADVLPFFAGTWKTERVQIEPKLPPEKARELGEATFEFVADGKFLRARGTNGGREVILVYSFDAAADKLNCWFALSGRNPIGPAEGVFDAGKRELQWMERLPSGNPNFHEYTFVDSNKITTRLYQLGAKNKTISEVQMTFKRVQGPIALPNLPVDPKRPEEMKVLDRLVGEWQHELTVTEAGKQKAEKSESVAKSILQGHMVEVFETNETRKTKDYWLTWYDEIAKQYRTWYFAGDGTASDFTGTWDEAKKTMSWKSADNTVEGKWIFKNEDLREMLMTIKDKGGKVLRESTGTSKRIAPEGSPKAGNSIELNAHRFVVAAKERIAQTEKIRYQAGQISRMELLRAQADWLEARLALVSAEGDQEKKKLLAKALVANWRDERELVAERVKVGVDAESVLDVHDGRVAEARTRLAKAKIDLPATVAVEFVIPASGGKAERVFAKARELIAAATEKDTVEIRWMTANPLNEQVKELRTELLETGRRHAGKHEAIVAAKLLSEIAWPLDTRHHAQVTDKQFAAIGFKDPLKAPTEIVGVIETPCQNFDISFVAFSPDGHWAALSACTTLLIVDLGNGKVRHKFDCPGGHHFSAAAFSPDGKTIAVAGLDGQITMRDAASGVESYKLPGLFFSLAFSGDGKKLFAGGGEYKTLSNKLVLSVWDLEQRKLIRVDEPKPDFFPGTVTLSPDRKIVASTDAVGGAMVRWWNTADGKLIWFEKTQRQEKGRSPVVLSPDGKFLAAGAEKPVLKIWDATTGRAKHSLTTDSTVFDLSYSPDGSVLAMQEGFEKISLWDTSSYVKRSTIPVSGVSIAIAPDSRHLLVHQGARVVILRLRGVSQK